MEQSIDKVGDHFVEERQLFTGSIGHHCTLHRAVQGCEKIFVSQKCKS